MFQPIQLNKYKFDVSNFVNRHNLYLHFVVHSLRIDSIPAAAQLYLGKHRQSFNQYTCQCVTVVSLIGSFIYRYKFSLNGINLIETIR